VKPVDTGCDEGVVMRYFFFSVRFLLINRASCVFFISLFFYRELLPRSTPVQCICAMLFVLFIVIIIAIIFFSITVFDWKGWVLNKEQIVKQLAGR
jgi:hypothetical protein